MAERDLPGGLGLRAGWPEGTDGWGDENDVNLLKLSVLCQCTVLNTVAVEPGGPADGDIYLLSGTANVGKIAVRDEAAWVYLTPVEGWLIYDATANEYKSYDGAAWAALATGGAAAFTDLTDAPSDYTGMAGKVVAVNGTEDGVEFVDAAGGGGSLYRFGSFFTTEPAANEIVMLHPATDDFTLPADLVGSQFSVGTNPGSTITLSLQVGADFGSLAEVGTVEITAGGAVTFDTGAVDVDVLESELVALVAPADSDGLANCSFTFRSVGTVGAAAFNGARVYNGADYARGGGTNEAMLDTTATVEYDTDSWWDSVQQGFVVPAGVAYVVMTAQRAVTSGTIGLRFGIDGAVYLAALIGDTTMTFLQGTTGVIAVTPGDLLVPMTFGSGAYTLQGDDTGWTWAEIRAVG